MFSSKNRRHTAFTVLEILLAFAISLPILLVIVRTATSVSESYWKMLDRRIAISRANSVFSLLQDPICHAGFAMLPESEFASQFFNNVVEPFSWGCAVSCPTSDKLRVIYAAPLNTLVKDTVEAEDGSCDFDFTLSTDVNQFSTSVYDIKTYVLLHSATSENKVFRILSRNSNYLRVSNKMDTEYDIGANGMVMALRAIEATADGGVFRTKDFRTSGVQPRVDGIWKIHFDLNKSKKIVTVTVISSSDRECDTPSASGADVLPSELASELQSLLVQTKRNLFCYKRSFFLANLED